MDFIYYVDFNVIPKLLAIKREAKEKSHPLSIVYSDIVYVAMYIEANDMTTRSDAGDKWFYCFLHRHKNS